MSYFSVFCREANRSQQQRIKTHITCVFLHWQQKIKSVGQWLLTLSTPNSKFINKLKTRINKKRKGIRLTLQKWHLYIWYVQKSKWPPYSSQDSPRLPGHQRHIQADMVVRTNSGGHQGPYRLFAVHMRHA